MTKCSWLNLLTTCHLNSKLGLKSEYESFTFNSK